MRPPPVVTGISPAEGPPGTKVIIRGEHLGVNAKDVTGLTICGANCLLSADYKSASKIIARTGQAPQGKGDVIVTTRSGGQGSCTVQFKSVMEVPDPLKESAVWLEEIDPEELRARSGSTRPVSPQINTNQDPLGTGLDIVSSKFTEEQLEEFYPEGSGIILNENFIPGWFLMGSHSDTEFNTLTAGLKYLRHEESRRATGPLAFVKENVGTFLDAVDTLRCVQHDMLRDESTCDGGSIVEKLESFVQGASKNAEGLFQDVLGRKDDADRTRNALNVLQRFRFLFSLPQCIERNIQQGDYEMVISDYGRAKSLFAGTDIKIFKRVLQEVEAKIESFRQHLKLKLADLPSPPEEQKRLIRYLVDLDYQGDPAWECLVLQKDWLLKLMTTCQEDHKSKDSVPLLQVDSSKTELDIRASRSVNALGSYHSESLGILGVPPALNKTTSLERNIKSGTSVPQRVVFVEELSELLTEALPDLWKLGQAYFSETLIGDSSGSKQLKPTAQKQKSFEEMIHDVTSLYADLVKAAFFPSSPAVLNVPAKEKQGSWHSPVEGMGAWLPSCVRYVRSCLESLQRLTLPPQALDAIKKLVGDLRMLCAKEVFKEATEDIKSLHCSEFWSLELHENVGRITSLPLMFENIVMETLHTLREMALSGETDKRKNIQLKTDAVDLFKEMFQAFIKCLHHLAFQPDQESDKVSLSSPKGSTGSESQENLERSSLSTEDNTPDVDERLLIVLNNCRYVRNSVLPKLVDSFRNNDYPISDKLKKDLTSEVCDLENKIFKEYIDQKAEPLLTHVESGMTIGDFKWHNCLPPKDVRSYVKDVIMSLVTVHAQVFAVSEELVSQVLSRLTDMLADEFCKLISGVKTFTSAGAVTAHLEAQAIQEALAAYLSQHARDSFQAAFSKVPSITKDSDKRLTEALMTTFKRRMRFQLLCFQVDMEEL
ncbi:exocyst complex component 2-like isoform X1 [Stylophora pistillata]|uniref:Exocyst complex component 2 n=1 Tax=Stylophora pistillata TaxID=50429 RepID=A0A2B4S2Z5_STYPI|nr:exocyst complex component 2-like isoform X1 [Stylophora pistillata]PFX23413.1 Exocyst complex component 2 [Stylophora pistillata]